MPIHRFTLVRIADGWLEHLDYIGTRKGLPAGWSIHKRSGAL